MKDEKVAKDWQNYSPKWVLNRHILLNSDNVCRTRNASGPDYNQVSKVCL